MKASQISAAVVLAGAFAVTSYSPARTVRADEPLPASSGSKFHVVATPNENFNNDVGSSSASAPDDIWAVGDEMLHYDGMKFKAYEPEQFNGNPPVITGVADLSPTNAWAVGYISPFSSQPVQVIEHWDGASWTVFTGPTFGPHDITNLFAVTAIAADDIWAVGDQVDDQGFLRFTFEHFDGTSWSLTNPEITENGGAFLMSISAAASNDVWAVGWSGFENDDSNTLVMHYDGTSWKQVSSPSVGGGANQLNGVEALATDDVWAVGFSTSVAPPQEAPTLDLVEHWDGKKWSVVPSPNIGPNRKFQSNRLFGVTAVTPSDLYAYGSHFEADGSGQQKTTLMHWAGTHWRIIPSPDPTGSAGFLSDLLFTGVCPEPGNVWLFGAELKSPHTDSLAIHTRRG